ncbi:hypothetical protein [Nonomuraea africana]|uniref:Uncharacterized protein n=1 Tax=Nonomuraea africana TaxID=46171 RepID=A0ABR9KIZ8_9ACTN|nr:hypothetical protein [Nonomuraea africana]MBE1561994.1 hypothetical protein [Nonomuraea africana]
MPGWPSDNWHRSGYATAGQAAVDMWAESVTATGPHYPDYRLPDRTAGR